ncbi:PLP-dependent transferase [Durotheca rogersii]|uniref:PLP-dependent transferase n=1 Tax=Durotheca rogersii TaxID=419775 RepID=UPI0022206149|nr:PLP-dependent transferase [Durotheca rogersii]KAI5860118.1 PLP-dependent transferase [Durotheca rogersii]
MDTEAFLTASYARIRARAAVTPGTSVPTLPTAAQLTQARASLPGRGEEATALAQGRGPAATVGHLVDDIAPALAGHNRSGRYFGFVTGSCLPIAEAADNLVSALDQNVQVHLPGQSAATDVEDAALRLLIRLLRLDEDPAITWEGRTFTTGATASNILGLACGREAVVAARLPAGSPSVGELGLLGACAAAGVRSIEVLTSLGHSSLAKAAAVVGVGRASVRELPRSAAEPWGLDLEGVEAALAAGAAAGVAAVIAVSAGEVNTGRFATRGGADMRRLRALADRYRAWVHVDGAFGIFARALPDTPEFAALRAAAGGLELADSITVDGHKLLNVPYDTGIFFTRKSATLHAVFQNPNAAYLAAPSDTAAIPSPLNIGIENSRRFRALPAYAVLVSEGAAGVGAMLARGVRAARGIAAAVLRDLAADYELLPAAADDGDDDARVAATHVVVLLRARDPGLNADLAARVQAGAEWYASATRWAGAPACRVAVASWRVDPVADVALVRDGLARIAREWRAEKDAAAAGN